MKKKPNYKAEKYMIGAAIALIIIAFAGIVYVVLDSAGIIDNIVSGEPEQTTEVDTTIPTAVIEHEDVEEVTNADGTPKRVVYYKDNVYDGSIEYVYDGATVYEVHFDAKDQLVKSIKKTINEVGSIVYESHSDADQMLTEVEITYYDDLVTAWKKLTTDHTGDKEIATKEIFSEDSLLIEKYVYEDSVEVSHVVYTYDENGEIVSEEEILK
ncbi:MAG: hypothetical protein IKK26_01125 [Clostridia bacterium]|nr:hypothetical protein [Clostridia bacterium]